MRTTDHFVLCRRCWQQWSSVSDKPCQHCPHSLPFLPPFIALTGKDKGSGFTFTQQEVDGLLTYSQDQLSGALAPFWPSLPAHWLQPIVYLVTGAPLPIATQPICLLDN